MTRSAFVSAGFVLVWICLIAGCSGGGGGTPPPPPVSNPVPAITSLAPASVVAGSGATTVTITGSGFIASSSAQWNGTALATTYVDATSLSAAVPATSLASSANAQITVQNPGPGGGTSAAAAFAVNSPQPAITSISPQVVPPGVAATITLNGTGFEANSVVQWNGAAKPTTFVSSTSLTVALTAADVQNTGTGSLTVSNPGPSASVSAGSSLTVAPVPVIQSVSIAPDGSPQSACQALRVTITGTGFDGNSQVELNGASPLPTAVLLPTTLTAELPGGFHSAPGQLSLTVSNLDQPATVSNAYVYPASNPPVVALCVKPVPATVYPNSTFSFTVQPSEVNFSGNGTLTFGTLPAGISTSTNSVSLPATGALLYLQAGSSLAAGDLDIPFNVTTGATTAAGSFPITVSTGAPPSFGFSGPIDKNAVGVPIGGSGSISFLVLAGGTDADYAVTPSVSGLPPGTTATFSPNPVPVGQTVTVTVTAANNAPVTQNAQATLTGTATLAPAASIKFFADVTQPPGSLPGNRTDFTTTRGSPYQCAYDALHGLIFCSNPSWNRVDVISDSTHKIVKEIPVLSPRGIDVTPDNSKVWVQTASQNIYAIDCVSLQASHYVIPSGIGSSGLAVQFAIDAILALADGTLFISFDDSGNSGGIMAGVWNPQNDQLTVLTSGPISNLGTPVKSGDGKMVYAAYGPLPISSGMGRYSVATKTFTTLNSGTKYGPVMAVNRDGSRLLVEDYPLLDLYDNNLNSVGSVIGYGASSIFSQDGSKIYEDGPYEGLQLILTIDTSTLTILQTAPSVSTSGSGSTLFAVDATGLLLGVQNYGVSWEDANFSQNYVSNMPLNSVIASFQTFSGPLSGGTSLPIYASPSLQPDVWFGQTRGSTDIANSQLEFTSPPGSTPGPVNVKFIFPDGEQAFFPQLFSYGTVPQFALTSGSSPDGGAAARVLGYGLPGDSSGGSISIGGTPATITTTQGQYPPLSTEPIPSTLLDYTLPAGTPGLADLQVTTPIGTGTLPKAIFYAQSVVDYGSSDQFAAILPDTQRNRLYLTAGDHIDIFSLDSNRYLTPLKPTGLSANAQLAGMALTPDGSQLLVADPVSNAIVSMNPDDGSSSAPISFPAQVNPDSMNCLDGARYVAATSVGTAFVNMGGAPYSTCPWSGLMYTANLTSKAVAPVSTLACNTLGAYGVDSSADGNYVAMGYPVCIYNAKTNSFAGTFQESPNLLDATISGDGNAVVSADQLWDNKADRLGSIAQPVALNQLPSTYPSPFFAYARPRLNASGSLFYAAYPYYFEIVDVAHGLLRMRFALTQVIQRVPAPIAVDPSGRHVYLITDRGLTIVDLGHAPLSIGHLSAASAAAGTQVTVRGSGFDSGTAATIGGISATVGFTDENTLTLTVPGAAAGPQDIVLKRSDGETYTLENGIVVQ